MNEAQAPAYEAPAIVRVVDVQGLMGIGGDKKKPKGGYR